MKRKFLLSPGLFFAPVVIAVTCSSLHAADGIWTAVAAGNWNDPLNWAGGTIASGVTNSATFGSDITAATTVNQDVTGLQIGNITFSDNGGNGSAWTLSGANSIALGDGSSTGSSTITTTTAATISSVLTGANSVTKAGTATLTLSGANTYTGGTILNGAGTLAVGNATALGTGAVTVNANSTLSYSTAFANNVVLNSANLSVSGGFSNMSGIISGTGNLTATGTVQITGANTFSGKTTITGGFFTFKADNAFGAVPATPTADSISLSGGGTFSTYISGAAFTLHANRGIVIAAGYSGDWDIGNTLNIAGVISGSGRVSKTANSGGTLVLSNANTYSGGTILAKGIISLGTGGTGADTSTVNALGTGSVAINTGGTLRLWIQNTNSYTIPNNFTMNGGVLLGQDGLYTLPGTIALGASGGTISATWPGKTVTSSGAISGSGPLSITQNTGTTAAGGGVIFTGANTYTGATSILGATLSVSSINSVSGGTASSGLGAPVTLANGTIAMGSVDNIGGLTYLGTGETTDRVINLNGLSGGATISQSGTGLLKFTSPLTATGLGSKTLALAGATTGTGEISGAIGDNLITGSIGLSATFGTGATSVTLGSINGISVGATISGTGIAPGTTITVINPATRVVTLSTPATAASGTVGSSYAVTGAVNLTALSKSGTGSWKLSGTNTYSGGTTVSAGTLVSSAAGSLGSTSGALAITGGTLDLNATSQTVGAVTFSGGGIQNGTLSGSSYLGTAGTSVVSAILTGGIGLTNSGGVLTLSGANTYTGGTSITGGTLVVANAAGLGTGSVTVSANGNLSNTVNFTSNIAINSGVTLGLTGGNFSRINGVISGAGGISSSASSLLGIANTYTGKTRITGGFLCIGADTSLGTTPSSFTADSLSFTGGYLSMYGSAAATVALNANRGITLTSGTGSFDVSAGQTLTVNGVITGPGNLNHNSANNSTGGTLVLAGANTYTGATSVTKGTLAGTGSSASALTVAAPATLSPGVGVGTWSATSATFAAGATFKVEINTLGGTSDKLAASGAVSIGAVTLSLSDLGSGTLAGGTKLTLIDYTGGSLTGAFSGYAEGASITINSNTYVLHYADSSKVTLTVVGSGSYQDWAAAYAGGEAANLDFDHDGVPNGVEYFMGETSGFTANPQLVDGVITWPKDPNAAVSYVVETSTDLDHWDPAIGVNDTGTSVIYSMQVDGPKTFVRLRVIP